MKVIFSNRAYASILAETTEKIRTETGGLFLGAIEGDVWYVVEAIDPGPKSVFEVAYFEYDQQYTQHLINKIANLYDHKLELIGLWHRHPGSFDQFSSTDDGTNAKYAAMHPQGALSALVNIDPSFRLTVYHVGSPCRYARIAYDVGDHLIPDQYLKLKTPDTYMTMMDRMMRGGRPEGYHLGVSFGAFMKTIKPFLADYTITDLDVAQMEFDTAAQDRILDCLMEDLAFLSDEVKVEVSLSMLDQALMMYQQTHDRVTRMYFGYSAQKNTVVFSYRDVNYLYASGQLRRAYLAAKAYRDSMAAESRAPKSPRQLVEHVVKAIRNNKSEE